MSTVSFIATKHEGYPRLHFESGSTVLDPWRYMPDSPTWKVRRIGENKPALISILVPSRGRPEMLERTMTTAYETATHERQIEFVVRLDDDDPALDAYRDTPYPDDFWLVGERALLSACWNDCYQLAHGEILMHCGDDITFNSNGWDQIIRDTFAAIPDRIAFVHGDDLSTNFPLLGTHGFVHRRWVETIGYFLPPLFSSDWNDVWLNEVADMVDRHIALPNVITEHHHYTFGKSERDQTHADREERGERDGVVDLFKRTLKERKADARKLKAVMA